MRATDDRYTAERDRFDLAIRMIRHEARTGTIRLCTGFTEDRIRKIYASYFPGQGQTGAPPAWQDAQPDRTLRQHRPPSG